jgi:hypothetical protein
VAIQTERNITQKEGERKRFNGLYVEIKRMWNIKCVIIPIVSGATGIVEKAIKKNLEAITGNHFIGSVQKTDVELAHNTKSTSV